jgi:hypothetical protein
LKTPREVRNAFVYVLGNFRKHGARRGGKSRARDAAPRGIDAYSSAEWFDGWREWKPWSGTPPPFAELPAWRPRGVIAIGDEATEKVVAEPQTWLAAAGWRRHGLLRLDEAPAA